MHGRGVVLQAVAAYSTATFSRSSWGMFSMYILFLEMLLFIM